MSFLIPDEQATCSAYLDKLKRTVKEEAINKNNKLNERFGISRYTVLYCELAIAAQLRELSDETSQAEE